MLEDEPDPVLQGGLNRRRAGHPLQRRNVLFLNTNSAVHAVVQKRGRVVCPYYGHPALTSSFTKYKFLQMFLRQL